MGKLVLSMNLSLDGYVDDVAGTLVMPPPSPELFQFWIDEVNTHAATIYGQRMYDTMRYWDTDQPNWTEPMHAFAAAWRKLPKWVISSTLTEVGPNATLIKGDIEAQARAIKTQFDGIITVSGPQIAGLMTELNLIDEYHMVLRPYVLGAGKPFFHGPCPPLRFVSSDTPDTETVRLIYAAT